MNPRDWIGDATLEGRFVRLEPLAVSHAPGLLAATPPGTLAYFNSWPDTWDAPGFAAFIERITSNPLNCHYAVIEQSTGRIVGTTSFLDIRPPHKGVEIGFTWYAPDVRGTRVNPETKLLLMRHAFDTLGCERVQLKCDARNAHSQRAIAKLGAQREGVLRRHMVMPDGFVRDTVMFSVVRAEWQTVRAGLELRLLEST